MEFEKWFRSETKRIDNIPLSKGLDGDRSAESALFSREVTKRVNSIQERYGIQIIKTIGEILESN